MKTIDKTFWKNIHTLVFDFDGIFTDNKVYVDQNGILISANELES